MADDPTVQFPLRKPRECPTCGHTTQPNEIECSLCGTTLPSDFHSAPPPEKPLVSPAADSLPPATDDPTVAAPLPPRPSLNDEAPAKAVSSTPAASRRGRGRDATNAAVRPVTPPPPPPLRSVPPAPSLSESSSPLPPVQPSAPVPPVSPPSNALTKWGGLAAGALALFLVSFLIFRTFFSTPEKSELVPLDSETEPSAKNDLTRPRGEEVATGDSAKVSLPSPQPPPPPPVQVPQRLGLVTTAEQLLPIRIFGAEPNDELRGVDTARTQLNEISQRVRDIYTAELADKPQTLGSVILELTVASDGQIANAATHITGSIDGTLQQAIEEKAKVIRFAPIQGEEVKIFYPLLLSPERIDPATFVSQVKEVWPGRYKVLAATPVSVHAEANDNAQEVGTIKPGLFLSVVSSQADWLGVLSPKGKVGYVRRSAIFPRVENASGADAKG